MSARCRIANAFGMKELAEISRLNPKTLYGTLSSAGNLELRIFQAILVVTKGMRLAVTPLTQK
jgi:DNA-binding phage protein